VDGFNQNLACFSRESLLANLNLSLADGTESVASLERNAGIPFRQPGYLVETRGIPSPPHSGFGFISIMCNNYSTNLPQSILMRLSNDIDELALDRLIQPPSNLPQFSQNMDYCTIYGLLMNFSSGDWEKILALQTKTSKTLTEIMRQARPFQSANDLGPLPQV
jgi:hypothetical protein